MLRWIISILLVMCSLEALPQGYGRYADSLLRVAENSAEEDADSAYMEVGRTLAYAQPADAFPFLNKALEIASNTGDFKILCMAHSFKGVAFSQVGNYNKSVEEFEMQMEIAKEHGFTDEVAWASNNISLDLLKIKNYDLASVYLGEAMQIAGTIGDEYLNQFIYSNMGLMKTYSGDYSEALKYLNLSLDIRKKSPDDSLNLSAALRDIGNVYYRMRNYDMTKYYYGMSMALVDSLSTTMDAPMLVVLSHIYLEDDLLDSALTSAHQAVSIARRAGEKATLRDAFGALGRISYQMEQFRDAERYFSLQIAYDDSVKSSGVTQKIFELQLQRQISGQQQDIEAAELHIKTNIHIVLMIAALLILALFFAIWTSRKRQTISEMNSQLEVRRCQTMESLEYASKIQKASIPNFDDLDCPCLDKFLISRKKGIVSGNFYWFHAYGPYVLLAVIDTGEQDVPGGCFSMLGSYILQDIAETDSDPSIILDILRMKLRAAVRTLMPESGIKGADVSLAILDTSTGIIKYSGVKMPLVLVSGGTLSLVQGQNSESNSFYNIEFDTAETRLYRGDRFFLLNNGFCTHPGGPSGMLYSRERLYTTLLNTCKMPMDQQRQALIDGIDSWMGNSALAKDIVLMGFALK